ncbi:hypothetical protein PPYR_07543 [Photinus pyralis]|uniref:tRNA pseudouridine(55) synthase n=1 Tax=Photinus pyralis TaxID=7054 RepID=A0A5N4AQW8_PHOPY|nr:putative tRNA pseudouridine synthase Pus10 [Photinus pyralis]XP_031352147.1 putative tRNA pseudouridine synthase Pus10 [Photinus pyralis]KAB0795544.1 hypothetical protein PPYR_12383 [Photinus pyralis]KAB0799663.1 hypothetical protein PPYR_07543 [Photinus pyralis]
MEGKIYHYLLDQGCCKYCGLRYLQDRNIDFKNVNQYIEKKNLSTIDTEEPVVKQPKSNPCCLCLGLLQNCVIDDTVDRIVVSEVQKYDTKVFTCSISIPPAAIVREHAMRLDLRQKFAEFYLDDIEEIPLNKAWKLIIKDKISEKLGIAFENSDICNFSINVVMDYADNDQEIRIVKQLSEKIKNGDLSSRKAILSILSNCMSEKFHDIVKDPLVIPSVYLTCRRIDCKHNSIYIAGRYCKFSRELSQSPWIVDGIKAMDTSVEELIFEQINKVFSIPLTNLKFSSSGREDCDVRCLGKGRPFYIEILDPKKTLFTDDEFRKLESDINKSRLIEVRDLQSVQRSELGKIKEGEQLKTKEYIALCLTKDTITQEQIDKINNYGKITLEQKTPVRVLHRRPLAVRKKNVLRMEARLVPDKTKLFELLLETEAGTYVKEFVHGDFGRTKPSIGDIIGDAVDIIALDVIAIHLDWPKEIKASNEMYIEHASNE